MTSRERFRETMRLGSPDRPPYLEEGIRDDVLDAWHAQGLPAGADPYELFPTDRRERVPVSLDPIPGFGSLGAVELPDAELAARLSPDAPGRFPEDWSERVEAWRKREHILELTVHHGFFLAHAVHDWRRFELLIEAMADQPDRVHRVMELHADLARGIVDRVLAEVDVDMVSFSEPIGGNNGPILGPAQYEDFALSTYRPILDLLRTRGVETVTFITYANARSLIPSVLGAGFDCLWACEVDSSEMDYLSLRQEFGPALRLIGGIDLDLLREDEETLRREIERCVRPLLAQGGYVPLADGRVRSDIPYERYVSYRRIVREVVEGTDRGRA
jgi:hypothetical protein